MLSLNSSWSEEEYELLNALKSGRLTRRRLLQLAAGTALAFAVESCTSAAKKVKGTGTASPGAARRGGTLVDMLGLDAKTLDPAFSTQFSERFALYCIYDTLVQYDTNFEIHPALATSWDISPDGKQVTFKLQPNVKFHDGTDCDASAVKWNLDRLLDPKVNSPIGTLVNPPLTSVDVVDKTTVRLNTSRPWRPLLAALGERAGFIVSPTAAQKYGKDFGLHPVGSGPFVFDEWIQGSKITMRRFDGYWDSEKIYLDSIVLQNESNTTVWVTSLQTGEAQVISDIDAKLVGPLLNADNIVVNQFQGSHWYATQHDTNRPPFDNIDLVKAEGYATDRAGALKLAFADYGKVGTAPIVVGWGAVEGYEGPYPFDIGKAKQAFTQSGFGQQPIDFVTTDSYAGYSTAAQAIEPGWKEAGFDVTIKLVGGNSEYAGLQSNKYNWGMTDWTQRADPDGLLRILFHTKGFQNTTNYSNPEVDKMLDDAAEIFEIKQAKEKYAEIIPIVAAEGGYNYLVTVTQLAAARSDIGGFAQYPDDILRLASMYYTK